MKKLLCFFLCFFSLLGCFSRTNAITKENYNSVTLQTSENELVAELGQPYAIHNLRGGGQEYEYIERFTMGEELVSENHYFFKIQNGRVVSKRMTREKRPAYDLLYQEDPNYPTYP
ncbi:MAG: hypothetical protein L0207_06250 [Chlamydiae bacterium]|nr:hypothetical protein [Chlamydiota bacterium]